MAKMICLIALAQVLVIAQATFFEPKHVHIKIHLPAPHHEEHHHEEHHDIGGGGGGHSYGGGGGGGSGGGLNSLSHNMDLSGGSEIKSSLDSPSKLSAILPPSTSSTPLHNTSSYMSHLLHHSSSNAASSLIKSEPSTPSPYGLDHLNTPPGFSFGGHSAHAHAHLHSHAHHAHHQYAVHAHSMLNSAGKLITS
uniref:Uncharacterized protein n=1 Tax=Cacopsylla melanoneura TaxID=428564 RepID=A0A8D8R2R1_9HEMI